LAGLFLADDMFQRTDHGAVGYPELASADKGRLFLAAAVERTAEVVQALLRRPLPRGPRSGRSGEPYPPLGMARPCAVGPHAACLPAPGSAPSWMPQPCAVEASRSPSTCRAVPFPWTPRPCACDIYTSVYQARRMTVCNSMTRGREASARPT